MSETKARIIHMFSNTPDDIADLYRSDHIMTNKELIGQVYGYAAEIQKYYLEEGTPIHISVTSVPSNGVRLIIMLLEYTEEHFGFATTLYSISRRVKIVEQICNMFEKGFQILSEEDCLTCKAMPALAYN